MNDLSTWQHNSREFMTARTASGFQAAVTAAKAFLKAKVYHFIDLGEGRYARIKL